MKLAKATPAERAALVGVVAASAKLLIVIGRLISKGPTAFLIPDQVLDNASTEFVDAIIKVTEASQ